MWTETKTGDFVTDGYVMVKQAGSRYIGGATGYSQIYALYRYAAGNPSFLPHPALCVGSYKECETAHGELKCK